MFLRRRFFLILILILLSFILYISFQKKGFKRKSFDYCVNNNRRLNEKFYSNIVYIPELNLLYCDIPKAASTNLRRYLYVYLNQSKTFENLDRKEIWLNKKEFFNKYYLPNNSKSLFENENIFKFLVVRHPFRRIYSVYYDKFVNDHIDDTIFGWKQLEEDILLEMKTNETLITIRRYDLRLDFRTFILYIINSIKKKRLINSHWEQIVYRCGICLINYDWFGKIENFKDDKKILLKKFNKNSLDFPSKELNNEEKKFYFLDDIQLFQFFRNTIQNDEDFKVLIDYYKPDFQLFDYSIPNL